MEDRNVLHEMIAYLTWAEVGEIRNYQINHLPIEHPSTQCSDMPLKYNMQYNMDGCTKGIICVNDLSSGPVDQISCKDFSSLTFI